MLYLPVGLERWTGAWCRRRRLLQDAACSHYLSDDWAECKSSSSQDSQQTNVMNKVIVIVVVVILLRKHKCLLVSNQRSDGFRFSLRDLLMRINALPKGNSTSPWFQTRVARLQDHCSTKWAIMPLHKQKLALHENFMNRKLVIIIVIV